MSEYNVRLTSELKNPKRFTVDTRTYHGDVSLPPYLRDKEALTLISGTFPLTDYKDCEVHTYIFETADGSQLSGILKGFSHNCTFEGAASTSGPHQISVIFTQCKDVR